MVQAQIRNMKTTYLLLILLFFGTLFPAQVAGQEHVTVTAKDGDGIYSLLRREGVEPTPSAVSEFKSTNASALKGRDVLLVGRKYRVPSLSKVYAIFGSAYEKVPVLTTRLDGHVYYVVAGHGGPDPGTIGEYKGEMLPEDEIAYDTALRLARNLIQESATVYIIVRDENDGIRDTESFKHDVDEVYLGGTKIARSHSRRLRDRTKIINRLYDENKSWAKSQQVISLHVDAYGAKIEPQIDVHFKTASKSGYALSKALRDTMAAKYAEFQPNRRYRGGIDNTANLWVLNNTKPVAVLVELGNIRHPGDQYRLVKPGNRQAIADWLLDGLIHDAAGKKL